MALDYIQINAEADQQAIAIMTLYTEAFERDSYEHSDKIIGKLIKDLVLEAKVDGSLIPRFRALLKSLAWLVNSAHEALGYESLEEKLAPLQFFGLFLANEQIDREDLEVEE